MPWWALGLFSYSGNKSSAWRVVAVAIGPLPFRICRWSGSPDQVCFLLRGPHYWSVFGPTISSTRLAWADDFFVMGAVRTSCRCHGRSRCLDRRRHQVIDIKMIRTKMRVCMC
jgi:hypothetical protein